MAAYPTGVEVHGESLRIWFIYQGKRVRENLGVPDTPKNRKIAGELRASVCFAIKTGTFNYASQFPDSSNAEKFSTVRKQISLLELKSKWLGLKEMELSLGTLRRYDCHLTTTIETIGEHRYIGSLNTEDILSARKELLNGWQKGMGMEATLRFERHHAQCLRSGKPTATFLWGRKRYAIQPARQ